MYNSIYNPQTKQLVQSQFKELKIPLIINNDLSDTIIYADCNNHKYLSDLPGFNELPVNCIFDKGITGCGGTTMALESPKPYVILMPFRATALSKHNQYPDTTLNVDSRVSRKDIIDYVLEQDKAVKPIKIIGTYDSLGKIIEALCKDRISETNLLIDEFHVLRNQYDFRDKVINNVLDRFKDFKTYCFMSATQIIRRYNFDKLIDLKQVKVIWENQKLHSVRIINSGNALNLENVNNFINEKINEGLHVYCFINSLEAIKTILKNNPNLTIDNTRVVYSQSNESLLKDYNENIFKNESINNDDLKPVNFLTGTAFEGLDIMDEKGISIIVSSKKGSKYTYHHPDMIKQVVGRNRLRPDSIIHHFVDFKPSKNVSSETKDNRDFNNIQKIKNHVDTFNKLESDKEKDDYYRNKISAHDKKSIIKDDNWIVFNQANNLISEAYQYFINSLYWSIDNLKAEYQNAGFEVDIELNPVNEELEEFENKVNRNRINKRKYMQELLNSYGHDYNQMDWQEFLELNPVYKEIIERQIKTPEQIINRMLSLKYLKELLSDIENSDSPFSKIMYRIRNEKAFQIGNSVPVKQAHAILFKIVKDVYYKKEMKGIDETGKVIFLKNGLNFPEVTNTNFDIDGDKIQAKIITDIDYLDTLYHCVTIVPYKDLARVWKYLDVKKRRKRDEKKLIYVYDILGYKIIEN